MGLEITGNAVDVECNVRVVEGARPSGEEGRGDGRRDRGGVGEK